MSYRFDGADQPRQREPVSVAAVAPAAETPKPVAVAKPAPVVVAVAQPAAPPAAEAVAAPAAEPVAMPAAPAPSELPAAPAAAALPAAPLVSAVSSATGLKLEQVVITDSVENREPGQNTASFAAGTRKVYCWMKVSGTTTETLKVVWYANGRHVSTASVQIKFDPMRTWNYKTVVPGDWKVEIVDSNDVVLASNAFTVEQ